MDKHQALIFGTSRLHRPFAKRINGTVNTNNHPNIEIVFPKIGYFHTAAEILQAARFLQDSSSLPSTLWKWAFRIEPKSTTPLNEFDPELESCIRKEIPDYKTQLTLPEIKCVLIEISSLTTNIFTPTGHFLHTNPNFEKNIPYSDIYPDGYYRKFEPELPVDKKDTTIEEMAAQFASLKKVFPTQKIIAVSHLQSNRHPNSARAKIQNITKTTCELSGLHYIDVAPILDKHGFSVTNGGTDIHHLSHEGENEMATMLFQAILNHEIQN